MGWAIEPRKERSRVLTLSKERKAIPAVAISRVTVGPGAVIGVLARTKLSMRENREVPWSPAGVC